MQFQLQRGQTVRLPVAKAPEQPLMTNQFCVGVTWGGVEVKKKRFLRPAKIEQKSVDLDLSCLVVLQDQEVSYDYLYSPEYKPKALAKVGLPPGKLTSKDGSLQHSGDDQEGDEYEEFELDSEVISVDLDRINPHTKKIYFFLNNLGPEDFSRIAYTRIRLFQGSHAHIDEEIATFRIEAQDQYTGRRAIIMGKLERNELGEWAFEAIGETTDDVNFAATIIRLKKGEFRS